MKTNVFKLLCLSMLCIGLVGCGSSQPTNVVGNADQEALDAYEQALAEADRMMAEDDDPKN